MLNKLPKKTNKQEQQQIKQTTPHKRHNRKSTLAYKKSSPKRVSRDNAINYYNLSGIPKCNKYNTHKIAIFSNQCLHTTVVSIKKTYIYFVYLCIFSIYILYTVNTDSFLLYNFTRNVVVSAINNYIRSVIMRHVHTQGF